MMRMGRIGCLTERVGMGLFFLYFKKVPPIRLKLGQVGAHLVAHRFLSAIYIILITHYFYKVYLHGLKFKTYCG